MKHLSKLVLLLLAVSIIMSCKKDHENTSNRKEGALYFSRFSETQTLLWVGGEQRSPESINFKKLLGEDSYSWILPSYYYGGNYHFLGDTVEFDFSIQPRRYAYKFSNDSLLYFISEPSWLPGNWQYEGMGNESEIRVRQSLSYVITYLDDGSTITGKGGFYVSDYHTPESMIGLSGFQGIDEMGPNDTLLLHNQTRLYK